MSDRRLRELEQRWRATGDAAHEMRYVRERVRAGTLPRPRLLLAAYLGSPAALQLLGDKGFPAEENLLTWVRGLGKGRLARDQALAKESAARAALAAIACVQKHLEASVELDAVTRAGADWLACPCQEHARGLAHVEASALAAGTARAMLATTPEDAARAAARVVDEAAKRLRTHVRHQRKALRDALYAALIFWALGS